MDGLFLCLGKMICHESVYIYIRSLKADLNFDCISLFLTVSNKCYLKLLTVILYNHSTANSASVLPKHLANSKLYTVYFYY